MRGFTLIELMVVVVIIAILAVVAVPLFSQQLRAHRVFQTAARMADLFRGSRTRALARGAAVVVRLDPTTDTVTVLEGVMGTAVATTAGKQTCGNLPTRGCLTNDWGNLGGGAVIGTARVIESIANESVEAAYTIGTGTRTDSQQVDICFSPAGRTYVNTSATWTAAGWLPLTSPLVIDVAAKNAPGKSPRVYNVVVLPNGTARLAL